MYRFPGLLAAAAVILGACDRPSQGVSQEEAGGLSSDRQRVILVTGATGTQGGAVARELLKRGYVVRAMTRSPDGEEAQALAELGAEPVYGDFDDVASVAAAMEGVDGVFAVTLFWVSGFEGEIEHGKMLIDLADSTGVPQLVLTSVASADEDTGIPHFESKWQVEQHLHQSALHWTVIRPVEFMDNWRWSVEEFRDGVMVDPRESGSSHQWIAASDIGFFVAEAFDHPDEWKGVTLEIAGDELTVGELQALLSEAFGRQVVHVQPDWETFEAEAGEEIALMYRWFVDPGYSVDVEGLRERYPNLTTVPEFLAELAAPDTAQQE